MQIKKITLVLLVCIATFITNVFGNIANAQNADDNNTTPLTSTIARQNTENNQENFSSEYRYSFIGDSLFVGAKPYFDNFLPNSSTNAKIGRQLATGVQIAQNYLDNGSLAETVVIALGTNGYFDEQNINNMLRILGTQRTIIWINNYCPELEWQDYNNQYLKNIEAVYNNFKIVDWNSYAKNNPYLIEKDNIHPTYEGYRHYAGLILQKIKEVEQNN